jgi:hypothetical protein
VIGFGDYIVGMKKFFALIPGLFKNFSFERAALILLAALFVLAACKTDDYPSFVYTNTSAYNISFKTAEKDSPEYSLKGKDGTGNYSMSLDSGVRGRAEIDGASLKPAYTDWRRAENDIYSIEFFTRTAIPVKITNATNAAITLREKGGYLDPPEPKIAAGAGTGSTGEVEALIYTKTPSFEISGNTYPAKASFNIVSENQLDTMYVLISSP